MTASTTSSAGAATAAASQGRLMTDEVYREPATIGQVLPHARTRYLEWIRQTHEESHRVPLPSGGAHQPEAEEDSDDFMDHDNEDDNDEDNKEPNQLYLSLFRTMEHFPSKYLIDPESESDTEQEPSPTTPSSTPTAVASTRKRPRTTQLLFDPPPAPPNQQLPPPLPPGRIQTDASLYAMLRAWVRDDFQEHQTDDPVPTTAFPRGVRNRKTLLDYTATAPIGDSSGSSSNLRSPVSSPSSPQQPPPPQQQHVDILGWLDQDPQRRPYTPCYPTLQETRDSQARIRARHTAKQVRRQRLRATRKGLRRKGIFL